MNYSALIEHRKSVRAFRSNAVSESMLEELRAYHAGKCRRLLPQLETQLTILDADAQSALEGAAGYQDFLVGAPHYLVLQSRPDPHALENAGYILEDLVLKLQDMGLSSCYLTFADADQVRAALQLSSDLDVVGILAFGYGEKTAKRLRLNIKTMSNVDVDAQRAYYSNKKDIYELVFVEQLGSTAGLDELMGFYEDALWNAFYAASKSPSYLNRQPYAFVIHGRDLVLVRLPDDYTDDTSARLNLGIVMLHFSAVAAPWLGDVRWELDGTSDLALPNGCDIAAIYHM